MRPLLETLALNAQQELVNVADASKMLAISTQSVYRLIKQGVLPHVRMGRGPRAPVRLPLNALREWIAEGAASSSQDRSPTLH